MGMRATAGCVGLLGWPIRGICHRVPGFALVALLGACSNAATNRVLVVDGVEDAVETAPTFYGEQTLQTFTVCAWVFP